MVKVHKIILFRTVSCPWCHKTAELFDKHKMKYKSIYVDQDPEAADKMVEISGQRGVPVIDIDGKIVAGFDEPKLKKLLGIK